MSHAAAATAKESDQQLVAVVRQVADQLGNTPAICRQAYIHPEILDVASELQLEPPRRSPTGLSKEEAAVLVYLESARDGGDGSVGSTPR